jgi:hypothetical protein
MASVLENGFHAHARDHERLALIRRAAAHPAAGS